MKLNNYIFQLKSSASASISSSEGIEFFFIITYLSNRGNCSIFLSYHIEVMEDGIGNKSFVSHVKDLASSSYGLYRIGIILKDTCD